MQYGKEQKLNSCEVFVSIANKNQGKEYCSQHWLYWKDPVMPEFVVS